VVEHHDGLPAGDVPGDLDGVLHGLRAGVEQHRALLVRPRRQRVELLAHLQVALVRRDHEAGVAEPVDLRVHGLGHRGCRVADVRHGDAGAEVDELVAVHVDQQAVVGGVDVDRQRRADTGGDGRLAARLEFQRFGTGDRGAQSGHTPSMVLVNTPRSA
jgi:hypothetical protein